MVTSTTLAAGASGSLSYGGLSVQIPKGAFMDAVKFELLEGPVSHFQMAAPSGQTVISDFAFQVGEHNNGTLGGKFQKPVMR